jgi:hypothetical protein
MKPACLQTITDSRRTETVSYKCKYFFSSTINMSQLPVAGLTNTSAGPKPYTDYRLKPNPQCTTCTSPYPDGWSKYPEFYMGCTERYNQGPEDDSAMFRTLSTGTEYYPCNNCTQPYSRYGGAKGGVSAPPFNAGGTTQCEIADTEGLLLRSSQVYTRCRGLSTYNVMM